jgi:hypothetical protein
MGDQCVDRNVIELSDLTDCLESWGGVRHRSGEEVVVGYTGVHYAVKDAYSFTGVLITIAFFTFVAILFIPVTIIVLLVWLTVRLVQRHKARQLDTDASGPGVTAGTDPHSAHIVVDAVSYRIRGADRGPGRVDLYCYDCTCGDVLADTTPGQARTELREHLHEVIDWSTVDPKPRADRILR